MQFAADYSGPLAFRYPRGVFMVADNEVPSYELGKAHLLQEGKEILFVGYGNGVGRAIQTAEILSEMAPAILDLRFVKPLDEVLLKKLAGEYRQWFIFSDSVRMGGVGSAISELFSQEGITDVSLTTFEYPDTFIAHGNTVLVEESLGILPKQLAEKITYSITEG